MARLNDGILGGISGKVGPVVGVKGKSGFYLRAAPKKMSKKMQKSRKQSPAMIAARAKFTYLNTWLKKSTGFIRAGFVVQDPVLTGMQAAFKRNWPAVLGIYPDYSIDYAQIFISGGDMPQAEHASVTVSQPNMLDISWTHDQLTTKLQPDDQCMIFIYFPELEELYYEIHGNLRYTCKHVMKLPERFSGKAAEVYLGFCSDDRERISDRQYLGQASVL